MQRSLIYRLYTQNDNSSRVLKELTEANVRVLRVLSQNRPESTYIIIRLQSIRHLLWRVYQAPSCDLPGHEAAHNRVWPTGDWIVSANNAISCNTESLSSGRNHQPRLWAYQHSARSRSKRASTNNHKLKKKSGKAALRARRTTRISM